MSLLISCQSLEKSFGSQKLFTGLSLSVSSGDRIGLIGPNGAGKSTLLKILAGLESEDRGTLSFKKGLRLGYVPQIAEFPDQTPLEILIQAYQGDHVQDYERKQQAQMWLSKLGFEDVHVSAAVLSGGWKKRLSIALALLNHPDVLLLDEPTNHLDLEGVLWLEKFLIRESSTFIMVSHDRYVLEHLTSRIIEINRLYPAGIFGVDGSYYSFLEKKEQFILGQQEQERSIAGKARRETDWIRRSPKARTTKSQSRIDAAHEIFEEHQELQKRNTRKTATIRFEASDRQTHQLLVAKSVKAELGGKLLFKNLDLTLSPGMRLGLMGPNGSGKTTFLRLLAGELSPTQGTIKRADDLKVVYFDQHRDKLPLDLTLREALSPTGDYVSFQGRQIHVNGWCKRFLFAPEFLGTPLKKLSGGERARLAIARLMLQPADLLLLDEPTNDLDIETLQTLEDTLMEFPGAVVLITHDRYMLDQICNLFLGFGNPEQVEVYHDYAQWEAAQELRAKASTVTKAEKECIKPTSAKGLSYKENKEYELIEQTIVHKEEELKLLSLSLETVTERPKELQELCQKIAERENEILALYRRWEELSNKL
jgi:ABC transport system ATP-binding/permease protein